MTQSFFDEFKGYSLDKMAGSCEDMTYAYEQTRVPKAHYKKCLGKRMEEVLDASVEVNLISPYISILKQMAKENPKSLWKALVCVDGGISMTTLRTSEWDALETVWADHDSQQHGYLLDPLVSNEVKDIAAHGFDDGAEGAE